MKKMLISAITALVFIVGVAIIGGNQIQTLIAGCEFIPIPLEGKSATEIESAALDFACANFKSVGAPRIRLNRMISPREHMTFFGATNILCKDQKLALVILEGDFTQLNIFASVSVPPRAKFVGLLFDLKLGEVTGIHSSPTGEGFAEILNDPSLPPNTSQHAPPPKKLRACTYGETAPTVMPPNQ